MHSRPILERPFQVGDQICEREAANVTLLQDFLDECQHRVLIEVAATQVCLIRQAHRRGRGKELLAGLLQQSDVET